MSYTRTDRTKAEYALIGIIIFGITAIAVRGFDVLCEASYESPHGETSQEYSDRLDRQLKERMEARDKALVMAEYEREMKQAERELAEMRSQINPQDIFDAYREEFEECGGTEWVYGNESMAYGF